MSRGWANHVPCSVCVSLLKSIDTDIQQVYTLYSSEKEVISSALKYIGVVCGMQASDVGTLPPSVLASITNLDEVIKARFVELDSFKLEKTDLPKFELNSDVKMSNIEEWSWLGRFRNDFDVEKLAGDANIPRIIRPIELTLVPDEVK